MDGAMVKTAADTGHITAETVRTLAQAREVYLGKEIHYFCEEHDCDFDGACDEECDNCPYAINRRNCCQVKGVYSTRHSFLLEVNGIPGTIVVPRGLPVNQELFAPAELSEAIEEQIANLDLDEDNRCAFYVRAWWSTESLRRRAAVGGERFMMLCDSAKANALLLITPHDGVTKGGHKSCAVRPYEKKIGAIAYDYATAAECEEYGYEAWLLQYNRKSDELVLPADRVEQDINRAVKALREATSSDANSEFELISK